MAACWLFYVPLFVEDTHVEWKLSGKRRSFKCWNWAQNDDLLLLTDKSHGYFYGIFFIWNKNRKLIYSSFNHNKKILFPVRSFLMKSIYPIYVPAVYVWWKKCNILFPFHFSISKRVLGSQFNYSRKIYNFSRYCASLTKAPHTWLWNKGKNTSNNFISFVLESTWDWCYDNTFPSLIVKYNKEFVILC